MSIQSNSVYSEKLPVSQSDLKELADPFEAGLNRTIARVVGFLGGMFFQEGVAGAMLVDAYIDHQKGKAIRAQMDLLDKAVRDQQAKANPDLFIQKEIGSGIQTYTDRSKAIKIGTAMTSIASSRLYFYAFRNAQQVLFQGGAVGLINVDQTSFKAAFALGLITIGGMCYSLIRRYTAGVQLQADNKALASRLSYARHNHI